MGIPLKVFVKHNLNLRVDHNFVAVPAKTTISGERLDLQQSWVGVLRTSNTVDIDHIDMLCACGCSQNSLVQPKCKYRIDIGGLPKE